MITSLRIRVFQADPVEGTAEGLRNKRQGGERFAHAHFVSKDAPTSL